MMGVKRISMDRQPGQLIQIGLDGHVNLGMSASGLFSNGMVEVMVARVDMEKATLMVAAPEHFLIMCKSSFIDE